MAERTAFSSSSACDLKRAFQKCPVHLSSWLALLAMLSFNVNQGHPLMFGKIEETKINLGE
jgi:hypothetical protein